MAKKHRTKKEIDLLDPELDKPHKGTKFKPEYVELIYRFCLLTNATEKEICAFLGIAPSTLFEWKKKYPEFKNNIMKGKRVADGEVAEALYKRAIGYTHDYIELKVLKQKVMVNDKEQVVDVVKKIEMTKHYPPDPIACIFWLKNRHALNWSDKPIAPPPPPKNEITADIIKKMENADPLEAAKLYEEMMK